MCVISINTYDYRKIKVIQLTDKQRLQSEDGFRNGKSHAYRMRCRTVLLKSQGLTSKEIGLQTDMTHISVNSWVKRFETEGISGLETRPGRGRKTNNGLLGRGSRPQSHRTRQTEGDESQGSVAESIWKGGERKHVQGFLSALARDIDV